MDVFKRLGVPIDEIEFGLKALAQSSIVWAGVLGNLYTAYCALTRSKLPRSTNTFIVALSAALVLQALTAAIDYGDHLYRFALNTDDYQWGFLGCDLWHTMNVYLPMCLTLLCFFCLLDRHLVLVRPQDHDKVMSWPLVSGAVALCFLLPAAVCVPPIALDLYVESDYLKFRSPNECKFKPNLAYALISPVFTFWIPLSLVAAIIVRIFKAMDAQDSAQYNPVYSSCEKLKDDQDKAVVGDGAWKGEGGEMRRQHRLVLTLWSVYWNVALFWIPQHAWQAIYKITDADWPRATNFMAWAGYLPCLILPNLYCYYDVWHL